MAYPDHNGPPSAASASEDGSELQEAADRTVELCKHIEHVLFVEKFESFRVQMRMPKRQDPSKYRWVEFEMWAAKDPITKNPAILVNQTNLQETKKLEMELKNKHDRLKSRNQQLQVELEEAKSLFLVEPCIQSVHRFKNKVPRVRSIFETIYDGVPSPPSTYPRKT